MLNQHCSQLLLRCKHLARLALNFKMVMYSEFTLGQVRVFILILLWGEFKERSIHAGGICG